MFPALIFFYSICPAVSWIFGPFVRFVYISKTQDSRTNWVKENRENEAKQIV